MRATTRRVGSSSDDRDRVRALRVGDGAPHGLQQPAARDEVEWTRCAMTSVSVSETKS